jgi:hypothetical protein
MPPQHGQTKGLMQVFTDYYDISEIMDVNEQPVRRSNKDSEQRRHYSGKKSGTRARRRSPSMSMVRSALRKGDNVALDF